MKQNTVYMNKASREKSADTTNEEPNTIISTCDALSFINNSLSTVSSLLSSTGSLSSYSKSHSTYQNCESCKIQIETIKVIGK